MSRNNSIKRQIEFMGILLKHTEKYIDKVTDKKFMEMQAERIREDIRKLKKNKK